MIFNVAQWYGGVSQNSKSKIYLKKTIENDNLADDELETDLRSMPMAGHHSYAFNITYNSNFKF